MQIRGEYWTFCNGLHSNAKLSFFPFQVTCAKLSSPGWVSHGNNANRRFIQHHERWSEKWRKEVLCYLSFKSTFIYLRSVRIPPRISTWLSCTVWEQIDIVRMRIKCFYYWVNGKGKIRLQNSYLLYFSPFPTFQTISKGQTLLKEIKLIFTNSFLHSWANCPFFIVWILCTIQFVCASTSFGLPVSCASGLWSNLHQHSRQL